MAATISDYMSNGNLPFPFPDAVGEFSVESTALGAQSGMHSGGLVNAVTRSGGNQYHGSGFEFIRNNYLDGQNFFSTCTIVAPATSCSAKDTLHQNQYGGTFGGPVILPKIYNGKDKLFFFVGYQFLKNDQATANTTMRVPTVANLAGDFSATDGVNCTANKTFIQLVDPLTGVKIPNDIYPTTPTWNAQALALQKYLPVVTPNNDPNNCGIVSYAIPSQLFDKEFVTRIDYKINAKQNLYGRYFLDGYQSPSFFFAHQHPVRHTRARKLRARSDRDHRRRLDDQFPHRQLGPRDRHSPRRCPRLRAMASMPVPSASTSTAPSPPATSRRSPASSPPTAEPARPAITTTTHSPSPTMSP